MVTARYFPYMGGIETHVHEVGRRLARNEINLTLLTTLPHTAPTIPREEWIEGMRVIRVPAWPRERDYYWAPEISTLIKEGPWDLVHCQGCHTLVPPLAMMAAKAAKIPYLLTFHTGGHSSPLRNKIRGTQWKMLRPLLAGASKLIGVSHYEANYFRELLSLPAERFCVISNGSTLPAVTTSAPVARSDQPLIISIGRLERYKGHQHIISALPDIRKHYAQARLLILGAGPYESELRALAHKIDVDKYVEFRSIPASNRQTMAETLARATLVTLLSEYEAHPVAVMEALALRRPVLVAHTSGLKEIADQGFARSIDLHSSPAEIALAVQAQIEHPIAPPADMALPTWDDCAHQLQNVYDSLTRREQCAS